MIYSDAELLRWWKDYSESAKRELFDLILEKAESTWLRNRVAWIRKRYEAGLPINANEIGTLRKWIR
jgi:hypothetical protein